MASWSVLQDCVLPPGTTSDASTVRRLIDLSAVKRRSTDRLGTLVQAVAKRLIPLQQRPEPQEHESDTRYKARSGPRYHFYIYFIFLTNLSAIED